MPINDAGEMRARFYGATPRDQLLDKITQLRRDMMHIQQTLSTLEPRVRANTDAAAMKPSFSVLHNWCLSALESYYAMVWAAHGRDMVEHVQKDFESKFKTFTSVRSIQPSGH